MRPGEIEVRIEELVLHGFSPADRVRIGAAVERELWRFFTEQGLPARLAGGDEWEAVDAGSFVHAPLAAPSEVGDQIGQTVCGALAR
jgi:hypothetical protein